MSLVGIGIGYLFVVATAAVILISISILLLSIVALAAQHHKMFIVVTFYRGCSGFLIRTLALCPLVLNVLYEIAKIATMYLNIELGLERLTIPSLKLSSLRISVYP